MAEGGSQRDADDSVDQLITEAASLYGYANLKDEQKKVLKSFVEGKEVFVASFNTLACFSWTDGLYFSKVRLAHISFLKLLHIEL